MIISASATRPFIWSVLNRFGGYTTLWEDITYVNNFAIFFSWWGSCDKLIRLSYVTPMEWNLNRYEQFTVPTQEIMNFIPRIPCF